MRWTPLGEVAQKRGQREYSFKADICSGPFVFSSVGWVQQSDTRQSGWQGRGAMRTIGSMLTDGAHAVLRRMASLGFVMSAAEKGVKFISSTHETNLSLN